jgi:S1-C subfamily serine protease
MLLAALLLVALGGCNGDDGGGGGGNSGKKGAATVPKGPADTVEQQFIDVVKTVSPKVVQISTSSGLGSGVIFDDKGNIVTNAHVVGDSREFTITLAKGKQYKATLVGSYPEGDLAVVRLSGIQPAPAEFADSSKIQVGEFALALGNPLGLRSSVTQGIVSSVGRTVPEGNGAVIPSAIQTNAEINPGNSGGALVDINGRVIGIPTLAAVNPESQSQAPGIGFAIPSNTALRVAKKLVESGSIPQSQRAFLGVEVTTIVGGGVLVSAIERGGPADRAGIKPGDTIVSVAGKPTPTTEALQSVLATLKPGQRVPVEVVHRDGSTDTVTVTLGTQPRG